MPHPLARLTQSPFRPQGRPAQAPTGRRHSPHVCLHNCQKETRVNTVKGWIRSEDDSLLSRMDGYRFSSSNVAEARGAENVIVSSTERSLSAWLLRCRGRADTAQVWTEHRLPGVGAVRVFAQHFVLRATRRQLGCRQ